MNRRTFLKMVGVAAVATVLPIPNVLAKVPSPIVLPECPGCAAGFPTKETVGWVVYKPHPVIINDNAITKIILTEHKENSIGHNNTTGSLLCGDIGSELHVSDTKQAGEKANVFFSPYRGKGIQET